MDLTVPAPIETVELPLLEGCVVRDDSVIDDPQYSDGEMTGGGCVSLGVWCQEMPQIQNDTADANSPGYYGYDDPHDCEEWCDGDVPDVVEGYYDTLRSDVAEDGFVFPRPGQYWAQKLLHQHCLELIVRICPSRNCWTFQVILINGPGSPRQSRISTTGLC